MDVVNAVQSRCGGIHTIYDIRDFCSMPVSRLRYLPLRHRVTHVVFPYLARSLQKSWRSYRNSRVTPPPVYTDRYHLAEFGRPPRTCRVSPGMMKGGAKAPPIIIHPDTHSACSWTWRPGLTRLHGFDARRPGLTGLQLKDQLHNLKILIFGAALVSINISFKTFRWRKQQENKCRTSFLRRPRYK